MGAGEVGSIGGWSVIAAAAGLVGGAYALHVFQPEREEWDVIAGLAAGAGLVASSIGIADLTESDDLRGIGFLVVSAVYVCLAAYVFRREGLRTFATTLWAIALVALVGAERFVLESDELFVIALAATGAAVGALAMPLREQRLWIAGTAVAAVGAGVALVLVTPPTHFFSASDSPGSGLAGLVFCAIALGALSRLADGRQERVATAVAAGAVAVYAVSLAILEVAVRVSTASLETDFERGHTGVSALWALVGLGLLVFGLYRPSTVLRYAGLVVFGLSLAKIFLFDLAELSSVARAFSFILVGGLLLAGGCFLQRLSSSLEAQEPDSGPEPL